MLDAQENRRDAAVAEVSCPHCGAAVPSGASKCWLCYTPIVASDGQTVLTRAGTGREQGAPIAPTSGFSLASLMMLVTLVCVVLGVFTIAPGIGVPLAIVAAITWLRTVSVVKSRASTGSPLSSADIILVFLRSIALTFVILILVGVAAVAAFAAVCFGTLSASGPDSELTGLLIVSVVVLVAAVLGIVAASRASKSRWRRDHHGPK
jgi:hypothetical protein